MRRRFALGLLLVPASAFAQFEVSSVTDPVRPDRSPLAITEEVPAIFWLGLDGPAPLFVNPARAAHTKYRFAYATVRPELAVDAPVSFAGLFGRGERRWLVTADNGVSVQKVAETRTSSDRDEGPTFSSLDTSERTTETGLAATSTRARAVFVSRTDFGGIAFGLYGGYRSRGARFLFDAEAERTLIQTDPLFERTAFQRNRSELSADADAFGVGAELAFAGRTWDLAAAVSYQQRIADAENTAARLETDRTEQTLSDGSLIEQLSRFESASRTAAEGTPAAVDFEVVGALRTGRRRDDYLFGSAAGTFGGGTADVAASLETELFTQTVGGGNDVEMLDQTAEAGQAEVDLATRATQVSLGYVYAQHYRGMTILAALNPQGGFEHTESAAAFGPGSGPARRETDATTLALLLPLFVRFDVTRRLDAFGGGAYTYAYTRLETTSRTVGGLPSTPAGEETTEHTVELFTSTGTLYAGAVFSFSSGLQAQASFRGNLAELTGWTVSLGYQF